MHVCEVRVRKQEMNQKYKSSKYLPQQLAFRFGSFADFGVVVVAVIS